MNDPVLVDLGLSNIESVRMAFSRLGCPLKIASDPRDIEAADFVVLPGVGSFADGMRRLAENRLVEPLRAHAKSGKPLLGICLGMQLLADAGDEHGPTSGLGIVPGHVRRLRPDSDKFRVPNIGWCRARFLPASIWARTSGAADTFYFSHSYYFDCARPEDITAVIEYSNRKIPVAIRCGNVVGVQFHPEKSQDAGMNLLAGIIRGLS